MRFPTQGFRSTTVVSLLLPSLLNSKHLVQAYKPTNRSFKISDSRYFNSYGVSTLNMSIPTPPQAPISWEVTADEIKSRIQLEIEQDRKLLDDVSAQENPTFDSTIKRIEALNAKQSAANEPLRFFQYVSPDKDLRDASTSAEEVISEYSIEAKMRVDVYNSLKKVFASLPSNLDAESKRVAKKTEAGFRRDGLALDEETRNKVTALKKRLSTLCIQFSKNMSEEDGSLDFTAEELEGIPEDILNQFTKLDDGKYKITFKYPDVFPALKYAKHAETRRRVYTGFDNRNINNDELLVEAVKIRAEIAPLLGYKSHSQFVLEERMAKSPENVIKFLDDLKERLAPKAKEDIAVLLKLKEQDYANRGLDFDGKFYAWDTRYYSNILLETEYKVDGQEISKYFSVQNTVNGILSIYEQTLRLKFFKVPENEKQTWHEDVSQFHVWDASKDGEPTEFLGWFYLDLHPRPGKYGHAANFNIVPGYTDTETGKRVYPVTSLVCNFSKPTADKPSLLKHDEVVTLFHEMGHGIHNLVSKTKYARFHGTSVEWDFVEAPSQMLEFWPWNKEQIKALSSHYETKESLSDELIDSLIKSKHVNDGIAYMRQNFLATFDLTLHNNGIGNATVLEHYNKLRSEYCYDSSGDFDSHAFSSFGHLMGGYDSGYYGYLWSEVFAADMYYSKFKEDPLNSDIGSLYKTTVLGPGGSRDANESLIEFLGREPNTTAFLQELGVSSPKL